MSVAEMYITNRSKNVYQLYFIYIGTFVSYHYHWVGTRLGGQLVPPRVPVHVFVTTTDISFRITLVQHTERYQRISKSVAYSG
jgi:hypothetical protein